MQKKTNCHFCGTQLQTRLIDGYRRLYCKKCDLPIYENPVPASCLVVLNHSRDLLLVLRNIEPKMGYWCLPGGFMELGETPEQAALRELKEETGLSAKVESLLGVTSEPSELYDTVLMAGYLIKDFDGVLSPGDDASEAAWFAYAELPEIAFDSHRRFIDAWYTNKKLHG